MISYLPVSKTFECSLINVTYNEIINCTARVAYGDDCQYQVGTYYGTPTSAEHIMKIYLFDHEELTDYFHDFCFQVKVTNGSRIIIVEGRINISSTSEYLSQ